MSRGKTVNINTGTVISIFAIMIYSSTLFCGDLFGATAEQTWSASGLKK
jgi:hypothetical protein